jgi:HEAT repeat protein
MEPQQQAEALLEQAVQHSAVAVDQISTRARTWPGQVQWTPQIASLSTAALNSDDLHVRESGVEVELAAYGLTKTSTSLERVLNLTDSPDHAQKVWALWAAGLLANRGVESVHVIGVLAIHLKDEDVDSRRWATESLALAGTDSSIQLLLAAMHEDPSPVIRERAACGIAASGLFTPEQRMTAVPRLISYSEDPSLDAQTHAWAFQALGDITHQQFGNDTAAWRRWYETEVGSGKWTVTVQ